MIGGPKMLPALTMMIEVMRMMPLGSWWWRGFRDHSKRPLVVLLRLLRGRVKSGKSPAQVRCRIG